MRHRCNNPNDAESHNYGARGIKICERWNSYENFLSDMGRRASSEHSLERIDSNGNYEPDNCRWATVYEQSYSRRTTKLSPTLVAEIRRLAWIQKASYTEIAKKLELGISHVRRVALALEWKAGTETSNIPDREQAKRNPRKLSSEQVAEIRSLGIEKCTYASIARKFGISGTHARGIILGIYWKDSSL